MTEESLRESRAQSGAQLSSGTSLMLNVKGTKARRETNAVTIYQFKIKYEIKIIRNRKRQRNGDCPNRERLWKHGGWAGSVTLALPTRRFISSSLTQRYTICRKQSLYSYSVLVDCCTHQLRPNDIKGHSLAPRQQIADLAVEGEEGRRELPAHRWDLPV